MTVGERIKKMREKHNMTQTELAKRTSSTKQTIYKYENGIITNIPSDKLETIAHVLHVSPAYLMGWINDERVDAIDYYYEAINTILATLENQGYSYVETNTCDYIFYDKDGNEVANISEGELISRYERIKMNSLTHAAKYLLNLDSQQIATIAAHHDEEEWTEEELNEIEEFKKFVLSKRNNPKE